MRDISPPLRPHQFASVTPSSQTKATATNGKFAAFVGKCAGWFNSLSLAGYVPEVRQLPIQNTLKPVVHQTTPTKKPAAKLTAPKAPAKHRVKHAAKKVGGAVKKAAIASVKTPAGRYALIQGVIGIALVGMAYNSYQDRTTQSKAFEQRNIGETAIKQISRYQFLPTPEKYVDPTTFNPSKGSKDHTALKFETWVTPWNYQAVSTDHSVYRTLSAFWLTVNQNGYDFTPKASWDVWDSYYNTHPPLNHEYYLTVSGDPDNTFIALTNLDVQAKHINALLAEVKSHNFDGIDIDYEGLGEENQTVFADFIRNLTDTFHKNSKKVAVTVEARIGQQHPMDWAQLSQIADEIRIMSYDYHSQKTNAPGAICPVGWLKETLEYASVTIPADKLVIGLGNYGYDWTTPSDPTQSWEGNGISFDSALQLAKDKGVSIKRASSVDNRGYDLGLAPNFSYTDEEQRQHEVWFEDSVSIGEKLDLISNYKVKGVSFWSAGTVDPKVWNGQ